MCVSFGRVSGIEKISKFCMPLLLFILIFLIVKCLLFFPEGKKGLQFYFSADWSQIGPNSFLEAAGQAFFSLCIGEAVLITYGSFANKKEGLISTTLYIALLDTFVAIMSGIYIHRASNKYIILSLSLLLYTLYFFFSYRHKHR